MENKINRYLRFIKFAYKATYHLCKAIGIRIAVVAITKKNNEYIPPTTDISATVSGLRNKPRVNATTNVATKIKKLAKNALMQAMNFCISYLRFQC